MITFLLSFLIAQAFRLGVLLLGFQLGNPFHDFLKPSYIAVGLTLSYK